MEADGGVKTSILYAIEVSDSMLTANGEDPSNFKVTLEALLELLKSVMTSSPTTSMGVLFYGVEGHPKNIYTFLPVQKQDSDGVKKLMHLTERPELLAAELKPAPYLLSDVLFACGQEFEKDLQKSFRKLVLVTDNDSPTGDDTKLASVAETRCDDLVEKGVVIDPIFISRGVSPFNIQKFWDNLKYSHSEVTLRTTESTSTNLRASVLKGGSVERSAFRCNLKIQDTTVASVRGYNLYISRKMPAPRQVYVKGTRQVVPETTSVYINEETGAEVPKEDVRRAFRLADEYLPAISETDLGKLRDFGEPEINVFGTINARSFRFVGHTKHSVFIYPQDYDFEGSIRGFTALWQSLRKKNKYAVAKAITRKNSCPSLCVLVPSEASYFTDATTAQKTASGLHMVFLPYWDDIRKCPDPLGQAVSDNGQATEAFKRIIEKLSMKQGYNPSRYENPSVAWVDKVIEATALSLPLPDSFENSTPPSYKAIKKRAGDDISDFINAFNIEPPAKRVKLQESADDSGR